SLRLARTSPARILPNGENAHCTGRPVGFWRGLFEPAAARASGVLWGGWAGTPLDQNRPEGRDGKLQLAPGTPAAPAPSRSAARARAEPDPALADGLGLQPAPHSCLEVQVVAAERGFELRFLRNDEALGDERHEGRDHDERRERPHEDGGAEENSGHAEIHR